MAILKGWGGYPVVNANMIYPSTENALRSSLSKQVIARGMGRSYGDSANASEVINTQYLDHFLNFDKKRGTLTCESGVPIRQILKLIVSNGWFLPVLPGTSYVSLGGAIASDIHGKNHHLKGTFCKYVESMRILLGNGEIVTTSPNLLPDLFNATCGGMGLTGIILSATIKLCTINSRRIIQTRIKTKCVDEVYEKFNEYNNASYIVAWIDTLATGPNLGRGIVIIGEHETDFYSPYFNQKSFLNIPINAPDYLLNKATLSMFNFLYYGKSPSHSVDKVEISEYFFPLDTVKNWNKLYGKSGFVQYQFVLPKKDGLKNMRAILEIIANSDLNSYLTVLKNFGAQNQNLLSFPMAGYTLSLDFKWNLKTKKLLSELDTLVAEKGGRIYLTKDATMTEKTFKSMYSKWEMFEQIREKYNAIGHFSSNQSKRLGLL